jgi:hypothetical protein
MMVRSLVGAALALAVVAPISYATALGVTA